MSILFSMEASLETGFSLWVGTIPWKREWQPTLVLLPGKSHEQRSLAAYSPWDSRVSDSTKHTCQQSLVSPVVVEPFYNPIHSVYGLPFLHISVNAYYFLFSFNSTQPSEYKMISYYSFNFHFFWRLVMLSIFSQICWLFVYRLWKKCLFKSFAHFKIISLDIMLLSYRNYFYILNINSLSNI